MMQLFGYDTINTLKVLMLLMETDGHPAAVAEEASKMEELAKANGAMEVRVAKDAAEAAEVLAAQELRKSVEAEAADAAASTHST